MDKNEYSKIVSRHSPKSNTRKNCLFAFLIGGGICAGGEGLVSLYRSFGLDALHAKSLCSVTLIFSGVLLTALHIYDRVARHAGAGTLVPITGFANSMASPAIEFKSEGFISGLGAKMFAISGPVIVYGTAAAVLYAAGYYLFRLLG